jgi:hypothetical protein
MYFHLCCDFFYKEIITIISSKEHLTHLVLLLLTEVPSILLIILKGDFEKCIVSLSLAEIPQFIISEVPF